MGPLCHSIVCAAGHHRSVAIAWKAQAEMQRHFPNCRVLLFHLSRDASNGGHAHIQDLHIPDNTGTLHPNAMYTEEEHARFRQEIFVPYLMRLHWQPPYLLHELDTLRPFPRKNAACTCLSVPGAAGSVCRQFLTPGRVSCPNCGEQVRPGFCWNEDHCDNCGEIHL